MQGLRPHHEKIGPKIQSKENGPSNPTPRSAAAVGKNVPDIIEGFSPLVKIEFSFATNNS